MVPGESTNTFLCPRLWARWDALIAGEAFGRPMQPQQEVGDLFNEPYAELRERYEDALSRHSKGRPRGHGTAQKTTTFGSPPHAEVPRSLGARFRSHPNRLNMVFSWKVALRESPQLFPIVLRIKVNSYPVM